MRDFRQQKGGDMCSICLLKINNINEVVHLSLVFYFII